MLVKKDKKMKSWKQPPRGVPRKSCSENMQQIYRKTPMPKYNFNKIAKATLLKSHFGIEITFRHGFSPVNLLHISGIAFPKNTSKRLLLN